MAQTPLLTVENISKARGAHWTLSDISFSANKGEFIHLKGINGAGKSTLMRIMSGEMPPSNGFVKLLHEKLLPHKHSIRKQISFLREKFCPSPWLSVREYLEFSLTLAQSLQPEEIEKKVARLIDTWQMHAFSHRPAGTLSQGENQRMLISVALAHEGPILLLDEPTTGLDKAFRNLLQEMLCTLKESKLIIVSSHIEHEGLPPFTRVIELESGRMKDDRSV